MQGPGAGEDGPDVDVGVARDLVHREHVDRVAHRQHQPGIAVGLLGLQRQRPVVEGDLGRHPLEDLAGGFELSGIDGGDVENFGDDLDEARLLDELVGDQDLVERPAFAFLKVARFVELWIGEEIGIPEACNQFGVVDHRKGGRKFRRCSSAVEFGGLRRVGWLTAGLGLTDRLHVAVDPADVAARRRAQLE